MKIDKNEIISRLNIPFILQELLPDAKPAGSGKLLSRCPWPEGHSNKDANPSFVTFTNDGGFNCKGCHKKGSLFDLYGHFHGLDFKGALHALADRAGMQTANVKANKGTVTGRFDYGPYQKERIDYPDGKKEFFFYHGNREKGRGCEAVLYNRDCLENAGSVYIPEGEKHVDLLRSWSLAAVTLDSGSSSKLTDTMIQELSSKHLVILQDNDEPGRMFSKHLAEAMQGKAASIKVIVLTPDILKGDVIDWAAISGNDMQRLLEIVEGAPEWEPGEDTEEVSFDMSLLTRGADIAAGDYAFTFVVDKFIPENAITLFYAKGGTGKSTLASQIGGAVESGAPFMGLNTSKRPVVVIDYENPLPVIKKRIGLIENAANIYFWTSANNPPQLCKKEWVSLRKLIKTLKNPLLIIDTLQGANNTKDILSNSDYAPVMASLIELRDMGATIILLHHTPKGDDTKYIGATIIYNQCDHILAMYPVQRPGDEQETRDEDAAKVYRLGTKDKTRFEHYHLYVEFDEDAGYFVQAKDPDHELVDRISKIIADNEPVNQSFILEKASTPHSKVKSILKRNVDRLWTLEKGANNANLYRSIRFFGFSPLYSCQTDKPESGSFTDFDKPAAITPTKSRAVIEFDGFSQHHEKPEKVPVFSESDFLDLGAA